MPTGLTYAEMRAWLARDMQRNLAGIDMGQTYGGWNDKGGGDDNGDGDGKDPKDDGKRPKDQNIPPWRRPRSLVQPAGIMGAVATQPGAMPPGLLQAATSMQNSIPPGLLQQLMSKMGVR
jgi:hypothetical protein